MNEWIGQVLPFWKDLTETEKQMLLTHTALEEYEKGVLLHIDGGDCAGVQIVKEGQVRVYITSPSGGEITLYRLVEGDVSILSASCMIKGMDISLDMMMESDTVLYTIPKEIYKKLNDTNTAVKDYTMEMVSERFSDVMWLFNQYVFSNAASRLAGAILEHIVAQEPIAQGVNATTVNAGLEGFVRAAACELPRGIRINLISPTVLRESLAAYGDFFPGSLPAEMPMKSGSSGATI